MRMIWKKTRLSCSVRLSDGLTYSYRSLNVRKKRLLMKCSRSSCKASVAIDISGYMLSQDVNMNCYAYSLSIFKVWQDFRIYLLKSYELEWFIWRNERANVSFAKKVDKTVFWTKFPKVDKIDFRQKLSFSWIKLSWIKRSVKKKWIKLALPFLRPGSGIRSSTWGHQVGDTSW